MNNHQILENQQWEHFSEKGVRKWNRSLRKTLDRHQTAVSTFQIAAGNFPAPYCLPCAHRPRTQHNLQIYPCGYSKDR